MQAVEIIQDRPIQDLMELIYTTVGLKFGKAAFDGVNGKSLKAPFPNEAFQAEISAWINTVGAEKVVGIGDVTKDNLRKIIRQASDEGLSVSEMVPFIERQVSVMYVRRGLTIARTEVIAASNRGAMKGAQMTGLDLDKEWISAIDDRTRQDHVDVDGQIVDQNGRFSVGGELLDFPADFVNGSAGNTINCRCSVGFKRKGS